MELIDKNAVLAEIERLQDAIKATAIDDRISKEQAEAYKLCVKLRIFVEDTLEVKEVDLEKLIQKSFIYHESHGDDFRSDCQIETAFRTGFEDGFKCKGYIGKIQVNNLEEEIKRYFNEQPIMTRSKGIDYKLIPSAEKIAKHFFELGMSVNNKEQKGEEVC